MKIKLADEYLQVDQIGWETFEPDFQTGGIRWKLLHVSPEIGSWTVMFHCPTGSTFAPHIHHGPAEGYIFKGEIEIRGGEQVGGATARENGYLYEAAGAIHDRTTMTRETEFMLQMVGPVGWKMADGTQRPQGWAEAQQLWNEQKSGLRPV